MTTRMTIPRLARLIEAGDATAVGVAVTAAPALLGRTVERDGSDGWTPLHVAVRARRREVVEVLAAAGADLEATTELGRTPLHVALGEAPELVGVLCGLGATVDAATAAFTGDVDRLRALLDGGALPDRGVDLAVAAALGGSVPALRLVLERGGDPDRGALQAAAWAGNCEAITALVAAGADVDRRSPDTGRTALHTAVSAPLHARSADVVRLLVDAGADLEAATLDGATALDITRVAVARDRTADAAAARDREVLGDLLVSAGASH